MTVVYVYTTLNYCKFESHGYVYLQENKILLYITHAYIYIHTYSVMNIIVAVSCHKYKYGSKVPVINFVISLCKPIFKERL